MDDDDAWVSRRRRRRWYARWECRCASTRDGTTRFYA
jgi:hypothetical protein